METIAILDFPSSLLNDRSDVQHTLYIEVTPVQESVLSSKTYEEQRE